MMFRLRVEASALAAALCLGFCVPATAEQASSASEPVVRLSTDVFGGWDRSLTADTGLVAAPSDRDLVYGGANLSLSYSKGFENVLVQAAANTSTRYAPDLSDTVPGIYSGSFSLASAGVRRWSWELGEAITYGRRDATALFAGRGIDVRSLAFGLPASPIDAQLDNVNQLSSTTTATIGRGFSRRDRLSFGASANTLFTDAEDRRYLRLSGTVGYTRQLTRYAGLRTGLAYSESVRLRDSSERRAGSAGIATIDLGVSYARPLPFSRETTVALTTGVTGVPRSGGWRYSAVGSASLTRSLRRSWVVSLAGARSIRYLSAFIEPTLANTASLSLGGRPSRNLSTVLTGNYSSGQAGFSTRPTKFEAASASAQARYALGRRVGVFTEYYYFLANIRDGAADGYPDGERARHGVRAGLSFGTELVDGRR